MIASLVGLNVAAAAANEKPGAAPGFKQTESVSPITVIHRASRRIPSNHFRLFAGAPYPKPLHKRSQ